MTTGVNGTPCVGENRTMNRIKIGEMMAYGVIRKWRIPDMEKCTWEGQGRAESPSHALFPICLAHDRP